MSNVETATTIRTISDGAGVSADSSARTDDRRAAAEPTEEDEMSTSVSSTPSIEQVKRAHATTASISERENREIEAANASGNTPVVFIHGLWLLPSSWAKWADFFKQAGYAPLTPDWPDDPDTVEQARATPDVLAKKTLKTVADHATEIINALDKKPVVIGHSTGGLVAQMLAGRGLSAATVGIDPGVFRGVLPLPVSVLRSSGPFLVNLLNRRRAITFTFKQFKYGWANALDEKEAKELYDTYHVAGSGVSLAQMGNANLNPWTQAKVNTKNPDRGPLLIIEGEKDHTVPWAIAHAAYKRQRRNPAVTEIVKIPNRGHSLTIDHGWREVAQTALDFVKRFAQGTTTRRGGTMAKSVRDTMTENPRSIQASASVIEAAQLMREEHIGSLPITDHELLVGMITDRDITMRVVAEAADRMKTSVGDVSSRDLITVEPDKDLDDALQLMARHQVRRLPVVENGRLVGIVAQADIALSENEKTGKLVEAISEPSERERR